MGQLIYSGSYPDMYTFNNSKTEGTFTKQNADAVPANGVVVAVVHEVYCGVDASIRGQSVSVNFTIYDQIGRSANVECTAIAPTTSPAYIKLVGHPDTKIIDFNTLARVKLGGTNKLVTREDFNCPLYVNYRLPLETYTDPEIIAGKTPIKAVHMLELQENINIMRQGYTLSDYEFSAIRAGYTSLGGWADHIREMRAAIDEIGESHEEWLLLEVNQPRADIMAQMRRVVNAL